MCWNSNWFRTTDPRGRTRAAARAQQNTGLISEGQLRGLVLYKGAYWPANLNSRPSFKPSVVETVFCNANQYMEDGKVTLYECKCGRSQNVYLPRNSQFYLAKRQYPDSEIKSWATIGHITQWREYVVDNVDMAEYVVTYRNRRYVVLAYPTKVVIDYYNDIENLRLEENIYNSSIAHQYPDGDPLYPQCYIELDNGDRNPLRFH